ncbi:MAG: glycosyltransferase [Rikenellaceae bacterium]
MAKVSVIIPLYNTEDYIEETLLTITNQTLREIEIIIINDGSTDGSLNLVEKIKDERVKIFSQKNQGQAEARNKGVSEANGEYIYFMDSDDLLEPQTLEKCYEKCKKERLDILFFNADIFGDTDHLFEPSYYQRSITENEVMDGNEAMTRLMSKNQYRVSVCLNLIRRDYLTTIGLRFRGGIIHEDELYTTLLFIQAKRVSFIKENFFHRRVRPNSTMSSKINYRNFECYFIVAEEIQKFIKSQQEEIKATLTIYLTRLLNAVVYKGSRLNFRNKLKVATIVIRKYLKYVKIKSLLILFLKK